MSLGKIVPAVLIAIILASAQSFATADYITQTYIDTMIQRAFEGFNVEETLPDRVESSRLSAISHAKSVSAKLKRLAEDNPNKKYILWKVSELESQIYLEEQGLLQQKQEKVQKDINGLVPQFNAETGKRRPNFNRLWQIQADMERMSPDKGDELRSLIVDRSRNITREVLYSFDTAMEAKDFSKAQQEIAYCKINEGCLDITLTQYSKMEARIQSQATLDNELIFIRSSTLLADTLVLDRRLGEARDLIDMVSLRVNGLRDKMIKTEWEKLTGRTQRTVRTIERKEDSLVALNMNILKTKGVVAAKAYLDTVVKHYGMSREKLNKLDFSILQVVMTTKKAAEDSAMETKYEQLASAQSPGTTVMDDLLMAAKRKAAGKNDSLNSLRAENGRLTQIEEVRRDRMRVTTEGMQQRDNDRVAFGQERAKKSLVEIYSMLEKKQARDAESQFKREKEMLMQYLPADDFAKLQASVVVDKKKQ